MKINYKSSLLHHYTSIDTLSIILKNRTIKLNRLDNSNDPLEFNAQDIDNFGKFIFYSSWTGLQEESIPMWKLYCKGDLKNGVRISLPKYFYKLWHHNYNEPKMYNQLSWDDIPSDQSKGVISIMPLGEEIEIIKKFNLFLIYELRLNQLPFKMEYELSEKKLADQYFNHWQDKENININSLNMPSKLGRAKHARWKYEKEFRYLVELRHNELIPRANIYNEELSAVRENFIERAKKYIPKWQELFLHIHDLAFKNMIITLSPLANVGHENIVQGLVKDIESELDIKIKIKHSNLRGRVVNL